MIEALLAGGQFREAITFSERLVAMPAAHPAERGRALMSHATVLAHSGQLGEACDCLEETFATAQAELDGDMKAAEAAFTEALGLHAGLALPLERIETLLEFGTFLRRTREPARARPLLAEAVREAEAAGAVWLAGQAHQELSASGGRRRRGGHLAGRLTPQECRVFEFAAQGLSNEAIASRLRVSPGTVKTHLEHIYTKLGVHSRRELILSRSEIPTLAGR